MSSKGRKSQSQELKAAYHKVERSVAPFQYIGVKNFLPLFFQLHSEYKSTYRWHEFKPNSGEVVVVRKPPQPKLDDFLTFSRKKKHPDQAYRSHEFFDASLAPPFPTRGQLATTSDQADGRARSSRRMGPGASSASSTMAQRRARSEGPVSRRVRSTRDDGLRPTHRVPTSMAAKSVMSVPSACIPGQARRQLSSSKTSTAADQMDPLQMTNSMPAPGSAMENDLRKKTVEDARRPQLSESVSMGQIQSGASGMAEKHVISIPDGTNDRSISTARPGSARPRSPTKRIVPSSRPSTAASSASTLPVNGQSPAPEPPDETGSSGSLAHRPPSAGKLSGPGGSVPEVGRSAPDITRRPFSRSSSARTGPSRDHSRPPSAIENHMDYFREPVVKSPPEPTRVKSPEGSVRSPDPINWTVPLDTGKTFSVTQKSARHSPLSDHSSHFDSVSGTAINLGSGAGSLSSWSGKNESHHSGLHHHRNHQPKMSSLAKEARDLQPGHTKDSTMTKPALPSSAQSSRDDIDENSNSADMEKIQPAAIRDLPASDPMMTSVYQPGSTLNEADDEGSPHDNDPRLNGNGTVEKHEEEEAKEKDSRKDQPKGPPSTTKAVPGTSLRCLEDPSFAFDASPKVIPPPEPVAPAQPSPRKPAYRVLEDPMMMSMYDHSTSAEASKANPNPAGARAHEVLEGARETFDKFWGAPPQAQTKEGFDPK
ncbi:hypothetical protein TCAL_02422 [Tigriopus californicus]|uniref:Nuclear protein MDM1 n=1 Tax=Tigriopus californicus TaxID=6832 RepID=A0A553NZX8_TIGCA|nr:hypothetical protein TCAL_02422 [Tigriopus californicus]